MSTPEAIASPARACRACGRRLAQDEFDGVCATCLWAWFNDGEAPAPAADPEPGPGRPPLLRLPGHEVIEEIARGGMGIVYRARQLRPAREVALKMLLPHQLGSPDVAQRFELEAAALAELDHPGILPVYQSGTHDGMPFFTMKLALGGTLAARRDRLAGQWRTIAETVSEAAGAVHYAHEHGVLHRDLKPGNILFDERGRLYVSDFGLAKLLGTASSLTRSIDLLGTPHYMAPEVAEGSARQATIASDVYSLGAILFELLAGRPPFEAEGMPALLRKIAEEEPAWPAGTENRIPRDLQVICRKCLAKEPARRYASARELAEDLGRFLRGDPILARPLPAAALLARWCRQNPLTAGVSAALVLALAGGVLGVYAQWQRTRHFARAEVSQRQRAEAETLNTRLSLYAADMQAAHQALRQGDLAAARRILAAHRPRDGQEDLRGFEWRLLWTLSRGAQTRVLNGHAAAVTAIGFTPDAATLVTGSLDGTLRFWDGRSGASQAVLPAHEGGVLSAALSADGAWLASAGFDGAVKVWQTADRRLLRTLPGGRARIAFHPREPIVAVAAEARRDEGPGQVELYDCRTGTRQLELGGSGGCIAFSPDGQWIATSRNTGELEGQVAVWEVASGHLRRSFPLTRVEALLFSPDGRSLLASGRLGSIARCDLATGTIESGDPVKTGNSLSLALSPAGTHLAAGGYDAGIRLLDTSLKPLALPKLLGHTAEISALAFAPGGRFLASGGLDATVRIWDLDATHPGTNRLNRIAAAPRFAPQSGLLAHRMGYDTVRIWDAEREEEVAVLPFRQPLAFTDGGATFLGASRAPDTFQFWDIARRSLVRTVPLQPPPDGPGGINASPDGSLAYIREQDGAVGVWETATGRRVCDIRGRWNDSNAARFSQDNRWLAISIDDGIVVIWDLAENRLLHQFKAHARLVGRLDFSADNRQLATAGGDGLIRIWDTATWTEVAALRGHHSAVWDVCFSPDGNSLASTSFGQVFLWHLPTRRRLFALVDAGGDESIRFSPDGRLLVAEMRDLRNTACVWRAEPLAVCDAELEQSAAIKPLDPPPAPSP